MQVTINSGDGTHLDPAPQLDRHRRSAISDPARFRTFLHARRGGNRRSELRGQCQDALAAMFTVASNKDVVGSKDRMAGQPRRMG